MIVSVLPFRLGAALSYLAISGSQSVSCLVELNLLRCLLSHSLIEDSDHIFMLQSKLVSLWPVDQTIAPSKQTQVGIA